MIRFNLHHVLDTETNVKAKVNYSLDNRTDGRRCVTLYAKDYNRNLGQIFSNDYENNTDTMTDYFEKGRVVLFENHPHYAAARATAEKRVVKWEAKYNPPATEEQLLQQESVDAHRLMKNILSHYNDLARQTVALKTQ